MKFHRNKIALLSAASMALFITGCGSSNDPAPGATNTTPGPTSFTKPATYTGFPITLQGATHLSGHSVAYTGQMSRHVLRESAKAATKGSSYTAGLLTEYIKNPLNVVDDRVITAPSSITDFTFTELIYNELGTGRNLYGKLYDTDSNTYADPIPGVLDANKNFTLGMPNAMTARDVIDFWIAKFEALNGADGTTIVHHDLVHGYDYNQLFPKYLMGAVFYNQSIDKYLGEYLEAAFKPNDVAYATGKHYTGKEHSWDEGFGYFGAAAHYGELEAQQNFDIKKKGGSVTAAAAQTLADKDGNGSVSMYTEYNSGPAYYAALFDKGGNSSYGADIMSAWLTGRTLITNAVDANGDARILTTLERTDLKAIASTIQRNWEMVFAEAVYRYAGLAHQKLTALGLDDNVTNQKAYYKMWGEMKGFMLALQYGGPGSKIDLTNFTAIDSLIGFGPVLLNGSQVTGIDISSNYILTANASTAADYLIKMKQVQTDLNAFYTLKAKLETIL